MIDKIHIGIAIILIGILLLISVGKLHICFGRKCSKKHFKRSHIIGR